VPAVADALQTAILLVGWPGMAAVSGFVLWNSWRFHRRVQGSPFGRLVLVMVAGWTLTMGFLAFYATLLLQEDPAAAGPLAAAFLVFWGGTMTCIVWIVNRWGEEAVHINLYYAELAAMDRVKTQLIDTMAHELNTPLTPVLIKFQMLRTGRFGPVTPEQQEAVASIERNLARLQDLIGQVVLATQLQAGEVRMHPVPVALRPWLEEVVQPFSAQAHDEGRPFSVRIADATARLDPERMRLVLKALLSNAFRHAPPPAEVRISAAAEGPDLVIEVRDGGPGFTPEQAANLFQPFRHARDHASDSRAGAGLGLFLVRGLVEAHGGQVGARSDGPGKGAAFRLRIPGATA
jgi:signal transduction histidine kinase